MNNKKHILALIFTIILVFFTGSSVNAASASLEKSASSIKPGDKVYITVNISGSTSGTIKLKYNADLFTCNGGSGGTVNAGINPASISWNGGGSNTSGSVSYTFTAKKDGPGSFELSGSLAYVTDEATGTIDEVAITSASTSVTIITPAPPPQVTPTPDPTPNPPVNNTASTDATLKSLKVGEQGLSPNFKSSTLNYSIAIGPNVENITVTAVPNDSKASVYVTGNAGLIDGDNKIFITVTAADKKTKKTYTITATKSADPDKANAYLENLIIDNAILVEEFIAENLEYTIESIPYDVDKLEIRAFPKIKDAKLEILGNDSLVEGENIVQVKVTAVDGTTTKEYTIKVNKEAKPIEVVGIYEEDSLQDPPSKFRVILDTLWAYLKEFWLVLALFAVCLIELWEIIHLYKKVKVLEGPKVKLDNVEDNLETDKPRRRGNAVENVNTLGNNDEVIENTDNEEDNMQEGVVEDISDELVDDSKKVAEDEEDITDNFEDTIDDEDNKY
ncbi:MAG: cadherin-like beta sandwich domain-containing protein [Clostridia bacterium]|nr:cadherin-like beta sandwich domain-containing protein [Clostridia bacterium]